MLGCKLWTNGLICAFEFVRGHRKINPKSSRVRKCLQQNFVETEKQSISKCVRSNKLSLYTNENDSQQPSFQGESGVADADTLGGQNHSQNNNSGHYHVRGRSTRNYWIPIGWGRISELLQIGQVDAGWASQPIEFSDEEEAITVADVAVPYWECPVGPTWWCHVAAGHPSIAAWLSNAQWLHPAIGTALRDESKLISERMKLLLYEVPVRVAGGLLFELLGLSVGDPFVKEDDIPVVLHSWQAQNFLSTTLHFKGSSSNINVLGYVSYLLCLTSFLGHLKRVDAGFRDRWMHLVIRKYIFGAADEAELKFMNRRTCEYMHLFSIILNQEIRRPSTQAIRVKWSLHAREEIVFKLLQHLRGNAVRSLLKGIRKSTREMIQEQEAVRGRLLTIQDAMQSTVRAWLQGRKLRFI